MDNNLLKQLIAQHRRVVIPDFGAFLKKEGPEGEQLVFSPFLRKDDGVVTDAIISEYGVESEDARAMVAEFVIYLRQSLAASGRYYIEGVGMLAADANGTVTLKEGAEPPVEPEQDEVDEPIVPEAVPEPVRAQPQPVQQPVRPPMPQQVRMQGQPQAGSQVQQQGGMTRPQSIQVQQQPVQQTVVPPQPIQQPVQQPVGQQSFGGYPGVQQQPMRPPVPPQQPMRPPVPSMPQQQSQSPMQQPMRQPMSGMGVSQPGMPPMPQQRSPIPPSQRQPQQPMQGNPMPGSAFGGNNGMPPRGPQDPNQPQQRGGMPGPNGAGRGPGGPRGPQQPGAPQQGGRRPAPRRSRPPKTKADMWLIVAIIAALVVIAIMVYSFIVSGNKGDIDMDMINAAMAPVQDTTAVVNPGEGGL